MATKKVFNRMYEPWGYRDQDRYLKRSGGGCCPTNDYFANAEYDKSDEKIHFYNDMDDEVCAIDVKDFPQAKVTSADYDESTKELVVTFDNGDTVTIDLTSAVDGIEEYVLGKVDGEIESLSAAISSEEARAISAETILRDIISIVTNNAITNIECKWDETNLKMSLNLYNVRSELKDSVELFKTDENGEVILDGGRF